jgi:hypothetical protein
VFARIRQSVLSKLLISLRILIFRHAVLVLHGGEAIRWRISAMKLQKSTTTEEYAEKHKFCRPNLKQRRQRTNQCFKLEQDDFQEPIELYWNNRIAESGQFQCSVQNSLLTLLTIWGIHVGNLEYFTTAILLSPKHYWSILILIFHMAVCLPLRTYTRDVWTYFVFLPSSLHFSLPTFILC